MSGMSGKDSPSSALSAVPADAAAKLSALEAENARLRDVLSSRQGKEPTYSGYLYKYRPFTSAFTKYQWDQRWFTLNGTALQYYKTEKDAVYHPRGHVNVEGCIVEWEGLKKGAYWTFQVLDPRTGASLLRLSTQDKGRAEVWVQHLVDAGCHKRILNASYRNRSPPRSADIRWNQSATSSPACSTGRHPPPSVPGSVNRRLDLAQRWVASAGASAGGADSVSTTGYTSESGLSEAGTEQPPARQASNLRPPAQPADKAKRGPILGSTPMHTEVRSSLLDHRRMATTQHSGIFNLMTVVLFAANLRLVIENILKYGILANPAGWVSAVVTPKGNVWLTLCWLWLAFAVFTAYAIELVGCARLEAERKAGIAKRKKEISPSDAKRRAAAMGRLTERLMWLLNFANISAALLFPCYMVFATNADPAPGGVLMLLTVILWMKLISYAHCNQDYRMARREGVLRPGERGSDAPIPREGPGALAYPENITLTNLAYFVVAPTLVYQPAYPRSSRIRMRWIMRRVLELLFTIGLMLFVVEQYTAPTISNSLAPIQQLDWPRLVERVLKLALPTLYGWLGIFYSLFHLWLNILGELTAFGDREFYKEWWNSTTTDDYWRTWNMPVHKWMLRHVYSPVVRAGAPRMTAMLLVFFVSAVFHELVVGLPLHVGMWSPVQWARFWSNPGLPSWSSIQWPHAFFGIMFQVPMIFATRYLQAKIQNAQVGNIIFWVVFCIIGQPVSIIMYYHDWCVLNR
uniref:diacylglycerol O-acyltransferase n=1 Tax=Lobosphaera incisa TaxID=312850 RepID=A0A2H4UKL3_9CHLO|nr:acyl-CoA:1,2-diacylglycerol O-acyltransferase [Lobosphaera incisa]AYE66854.1 DGAT1 [Lobosphaera incisa]